MAELSPDAFGFSAAAGPKELDPSAFGFGPGRAVAQPEKPAGGLVAAAKQAIGSTIKGAGQAASDFIPGVTTANPVTTYGQGIIDANPTAVQSLGDIVESPWMATKEAIGNAAGSMAGMVGSAIGAKALGGGLSAVAPFTGPAAPIVGGAGKLVSTFGPGVAPIVTAALPSYGGIREEQIKADPANEADARSKAIAALGAGTVGAIETKFGPQDWALSAMKKGGIEAVAKNFADAKSIPGAIGKGILHGGAVEGAEELVQNPIEQLASYQDPTSRQAVGETLFGGAMGALGGGALGGGMAGVAKAMTPEQPVVTLPGASPTVAQTSTAPTTAVQPNVAPQPATVSAPIEINPAAGPLQAATVAGIQSGAVQPAVTTNQVANEANQVDAGSAVTVAQATGQGEAPVQEASVPAASGLSGYARAPEVGAATFDRSTTPKNGGYGATENYAQPVVAEPANTGAPRVTPIGLAGSASAGQAATNTPAAPEIPPVSTAAPTTQTKQAETAGVPTSLTGEIQSNANQTEEAVTPASGREAQPAAVSGSGVAPAKTDLAQRIGAFVAKAGDVHLERLANNANPALSGAARAEIARRAGMSPKSVSGTSGIPPGTSDIENDAAALAAQAARLRESASRAIGSQRAKLTALADRMDAARSAIVAQSNAPAPKKPQVGSRQSPIMRRNDLVGAIMRVTGGNGIASVMAQDIAGDKAGAALSKLRGLFTNRGVSDLGDVAMLLREEEGFDVRDGNHLAELIRRASSGDVAVSMERAARDADADQEKRHRDRIRSQAKKYGVKTQFVKFSDLEARVLKVMEQRHDKAVAALDDRAKKRFDAELERSYSLVSEDEVDAVLVDVNGRGFRGRSFWNEATKLLRGMNDDAVARKMEDAIDAAVEGPEPDWLKDDDGRGNQPTGGGDEADRGDQAEAPGFGLAGQSAEDVARQEADRVAAEKAAKEEAEKEAAEKAAAEKKSIADKIKERAENPDNFQFGEDAKAAAKPMGGLFDQPENHQKSESASEPPMKKGDRFTDGAGNVWEVWMARTGLIEAHPVVNGKPVVNRDSGVRFATTSNARLANPEARTDFTPMAKEKNPVTPQLMVGDPERYIKVAADSIGKLRKDDVYRVLIESNQPAFRADIARYIKKNRPDLAAEVDSVLAEESASSAEQKSRTDREPSAEPSAQSVIRATIGGQPEAVPPAVLSRIKIALNRLHEVERELAGVELARGRGHILALELRDKRGVIDAALAKIADFRVIASGRGIDADAVINELGGEPDFDRFGKPAAPEQRSTINQAFEDGQENAAAAAEKAESSNTEDSGSELTYNRRNRLTRGLKWEDIADKDEALRVKEVTKAKVYPKPDYQALIDGGVTPTDAYMVKLVYDSIAIKPNTSAAPSDADLQGYIAGVGRVMSDAIKWANDNTLSRPSLLKSVYPNGWREGEVELRVVGGNKVLAALQPGYTETRRAAKDIAAGWPEKQETWQRQGYKVISRSQVTIREDPQGRRGSPVWIIEIDGRYAGYLTEKATVEEKFPSEWMVIDKYRNVKAEADTEDKAKEAARDLSRREAKTPTISDKGISVLAASRTGIDRRMPGEDISSDRLRETFKFKGVNFGNWMKGDANAKERQLHLNHAYDSFMDLADVLGVPPEAMSLNGMLGVAVGAQGNGGRASAHFVPGVNEINLTRESGAGSLAHEWGHALDHYFARQAEMARATDPFLTERLGSAAGAGIRPEIVAKFDAIVQAMRKRSATPQEREAKAKKGIADAEVQIGRWLREPLLDRKLTDDAEVAQAVEKIKAGDLGDGTIAVSSRSVVRPAVHDLAMLVKKKSGKKLSVDTMIGVNAHAERIKYLRDTLSGDASHVPQQMVQTKYLDDAVKLDAEKGGKKYWSTNLEMFARAFDAFVSDALESRAAKNTYLSHAGRSGETVPTGAERTAINEAIKGLVDAVETKAGEDGNVVLFSFAGQQSATADKFQLDRAQQLLADGADAEAVRQQTGWFKGADGKWRYEIDDSGASLKAHGFGFGELLDAIGKSPKLADVLDHPALFAAYPSIAGASVEAFDEKSQNNGELVANKDGSFTIRVNAGLGEAKALSVLLHEIQHGIQNIEGFARGGSPDTMASFDNPQIRTLEDKISTLMASSKPGKQIAKEVAEINARIADLRRENPYSAYRRLAGEVEARNVQARQNFSADRRKYANPDETADTARADVIVVFNGKAAASAPAPANARPSAAGATGVSPADAEIYNMAQEGKSAAEILSFIGKASRRPFNRYLANALRNLGAASTITLDSQGGFAFGNRSYAQKYAAAYNPKTDTVALFTPREAERHVLHELVHGASLKAISKGGPASMRMRALFRHVQKSGALDGQYGMSNLDEFVAEAFSNPKFQQALKAVPAPKGSTLKSAWQWFVQAVARILGLRTPAMETALDRAMTEGAALMRENAELAGVAHGSDRYAIAWHGTPHVWAPEPGFPHGRPRLDKMGTGEGAQAYGWGWYSAEAQDVAESYRAAPGAAFSVDGKTYAQLQKVWTDLPQAERRAITAVADSTGNADEALSNLEAQISPASKDAAVLLKKWIDEGKISKNEGMLYQLDIPDDVLPRLLDWDKPLSEQSPNVQEAINRLGLYDEMSGKTGEQIYNEMISSGRVSVDYGPGFIARNRENPKRVSERLARVGIVGNRYLDGNSRADGKGTYNYVIWDQPTLDRIALLERNGEKLDAIRSADEAVRFNLDTEDQFAATERKVGGRAAYDKAKAAGRTKLNYGQWVQVRTPAFKAWFGDWEGDQANASQVVDPATGEPLVVYHGTKGDFSEFDPLRTGSASDAGWYGNGFYFTPDASVASDAYAGKADGSNVMPVYLSIQNPYDWRSENERGLFQNDPGAALRKRAELEGRGFDGVVVYDDYVQLPEGQKLTDEQWEMLKDTPAAILGKDRVEQSLSRREWGYSVILHNYGREFAMSLPRSRRVLLEIVAFRPEQIKSATGNAGTFDGTDPDIRYNIAADWQTAPTRAATTIRQYVADSMRSDSNTSWLTPFNTQYHKAEKWAAEGKVRFKRVFDLVQRFLGDVSKFAVMAQNEAPTLFHEWRTLADVKRTLTSGDVLGNQHRADVAAIASPLYEGTLYGGGNPLSGIRWSDDQLRDRFNLTARQIKLYHEALAAVKVSMDEMAKSIVAQHAKRVGVDFDEGMSLEDMVADVSNRMEELQDEIRFQFLSEEAEESVAASVEHYLEMDMEEEAQKTRANFEKQKKAAHAQIEQIDKTMEDIKAVESKNVALQQAGYFPLMRFGKHTVTAKDADGKVQFFGMYEGIPLVPRSGQYEANKVAAELRAEFPEWTVTTGIKNDEKYKLYQGLNIEAIQLFADHMDKEDLEPFQEFIRLATNNRSAQRRLLHRQGTPGFDRDVRRTLAQFVVSNARATSSNYHTQDMLRAAADAEKDGGDIGAEAAKLVEYVRNPAEEAQALRGFLFFNFLGGSLASAAVNLTQTPMMTLPFLSKFESAQRVTRRLMAAAKMAAGNPESLPEGRLRDALLRAEMDGVTAPQEIHQLTATAANNIFAGSRLANGLLRGWGAPFAMAESFNRRIAFITAFQIAESMSPAELARTGFKDAFEFAEDAVKQTQGIYNKGNRMNVGRGSVGSVLMTFKQYSIMYLELLKRLPPKQRAIMVGVLLLAAGGGGLPGVEDVEDLIDTIGQWLGFATNSRRALRNTLTEWVGRDGSDIVLNGLLSRMGIDLHSRMGMQNLIPGSGILKQSSVDKGRDIEEFFGPAASVVKSLGDALESLATGHPGRAGMALAPGAVRNVVQGAKMAATGYAEDAKGRRTVLVNELESAAKMVGFNPKSVADYGAVKRDIAQDQRLVGVKREEFTSAIADAILSGDTEARKQAMSDMAQWNRDNPTLRFTIAPGAIVRRVKEARTEGATRFLKAVPKGMRSQAIEEMRQ